MHDAPRVVQKMEAERTNALVALTERLCELRAVVWREAGPAVTPRVGAHDPDMPYRESVRRRCFDLAGLAAVRRAPGFGKTRERIELEAQCEDAARHAFALAADDPKSSVGRRLVFDASSSPPPLLPAAP